MKAFRKSSEISSNQGQIVTTSAAYAFGPFRLDAETEILFRGADPVVLGRHAVALLRVLVERPEAPVSKEVLMETAWPGRAVEESNLSVQIAALRRALSEEPGGEAWIETLPRRGYRFVGPAVATIPDGVHRQGSPAHPTLPLPDKPSIAVLPFQNLSADPDQEYFADGIVEDIITALSRMPSLFVIARNSSFTYKDRSVDVKQVGEELGVRYVLEGGVRKAANRIRVTGQLIDASTGIHIWADRFDGAVEDIFNLQDQMTASVVGALMPKLEQAEFERVKRKPTESLDAYDYYLRAMMHFYQRTPEANNEALQLFYKAIELDREFATAYAMAAWCHGWRKMNAWMMDRAKEIAEGIRLARRALALAKDNAVALARGGHAIAFLGHDLDSGVPLLDQAIHFNPNLALAWYLSGWLRAYNGEPDIAIERLERAMRFSPLDPTLYHMKVGIGFAHLLARRFDEASVWAKEAFRDEPNYLPAVAVFAASNAHAGRMEDATMTMARLRQISPALTASNLKDLWPFRRPEDFAIWSDGLRKAGLPD